MRKLIVTILFLTFWINTALAETQSSFERTYQIEIIVFSHITAQALNSEKWPWTPSNYIPSRNVLALSALAQDNFLLKTEQRLLDRNKQYQVLLHLAWRQAIPNPHKAQPIHIFGGNVYSPSGNFIAKAEYGKQPYNSGEIWQVNGTITPSLIRYINLKFNLLFAQPLSALPGKHQLNNTQGRFAYFRLQQNRRMRSNELNYISHPLYGVLVKVVPVS